MKTIRIVARQTVYYDQEIKVDDQDLYYVLNELKSQRGVFPDDLFLDSHDIDDSDPISADDIEIYDKNGNFLL